MPPWLSSVRVSCGLRAGGRGHLQKSGPWSWEYNISIFCKQGKGRSCRVAVLDIVFAIKRPDILEDILRLENAEIAEPDRDRFRKLVETVLALFLAQRLEVWRTVVFVLAAKGQIGVIELEAVEKERMTPILHLTPTASAAAFGHRKMQAFFCDSHFARFFDPFVLKILCKKIVRG